MAIRSKNLNLLPLLQALLEERSIAAAAEKMGLSQPAMSGALARLRELFDDPLLVRVGRTMQPTPRALDLQPQLNAVCAQIDVLFETSTFDPTTAKETFRIATPSYASFLLIDKWIKHLSETAPGIKIDFVDVPSDLHLWLHNSTIDVAIGKYIDGWGDLKRKYLFQDRYVVLVSKTHPLYGRKKVRRSEIAELLTTDFIYDAKFPFSTVNNINYEQFTDYRVSQISSMSQFTAVVLATQHPIFARVPLSFAVRLTDIFPLKILDITGEESSFATEMLWTALTENSLQHKWLRQEIEQALSQLM